MRRNAGACLIVLLAALAPVTACAAPAGMLLTSPAFVAQGVIPRTYTCDGRNVSPELVINNVPVRAKSLVLIVEDPDAPSGVWTHWIMWNIRPSVRVIRAHSSPAGAVQGLNDFQEQGYGGPCPPGGTHRYFFRLFALDTVLSLGHGATKAELENALHGHVLAQTSLEGRYTRK